MFWCVQHGLPMKIIETKPLAVEARLQGGDREVLRPGEARPRRHQGRELRRRPAVPERRRQRQAGGHQGHVELQLPAELRGRPRSPELRRRHRPDLRGAPAAGRAPLPDRPLPAPALRRPALRRSQAGDPEQGELRVQGDAAPADRAVRSEGRRLHLLPLLRPRQAGRQLALPAVAPSRPPPVDGAALRRALRPGHRPGQLRRVRRADRLGRLEVPRREGSPRRVAHDRISR